MSIAEKLTTVAENVHRVYEAGKTSEHDNFWDVYQENGIRTSYNYAFAGFGWTNDIFKPKHDIYPSQAANMLYYSAISGDFAELMEKLGVNLDLSRSTNNHSIFAYAKEITRLGVLNFSASSKTQTNLFAGMTGLKTIDLLSVDETQVFSNAFIYCSALENLTVSGTIGQDGFNVQWSTKLSKASIQSILSCLSGTTDGCTITLSLAAVNKAFETSENALDGSSSGEWNALVSAHTNWTITLV